MITLVVTGIGLLVLVAVVVGISDARQAPTWRQIAAERRAKWEAKHLQPHGLNPYTGPNPHDEAWDDD
jgi:hypothetical protein